MFKVENLEANYSLVVGINTSTTKSGKQVTTYYVINRELKAFDKNLVGYKTEVITDWSEKLWNIDVGDTVMFAFSNDDSFRKVLMVDVKKARNE